MEPIRIDMQNFLSYRREQVDLQPVSCAALVGENGAGKSSLLDALTWALFGQGTKGGPKELDNYVTRGQPEGRVELQFRLNGGTYKVVRGRSVARNKSTLEFFVLDGSDWRPLSGKTIAETQGVIEQTLRMDYRTFTASSLILQGKADSFTADMTDQERKEALARILGLDLWDRMQEAAREKVRAAKAEGQALQAQAAAYEQKAAERPGLELQLAQTRENLAGISARLASLETEVTELEKTLAQRPLLERQLQEAQTVVRRSEDEAAKARRDAEAARAEIGRLESLLARRPEVEEAVEMEAAIAADVAEMERQAGEYMRLSREAERLGAVAGEFDREIEAEIAGVEAALEARKPQAETLSKVPCSDATRDACPLLANARRAVSEIADLQKRLETLHKTENPHIDPWQAAVKARDALKYDRTAHEAARQALEDVRKVSRLKSEIDVADARVRDLRVRVAEAVERENAGKAEAEEARAKVNDLTAQIAALEPASKALWSKKYELSQAREQEAACRRDLGRLEQALAECAKAEEQLKALRERVKAARDRQTVFEVLDQACGKKAGVPALIVENAVPEIERLANDMLTKMAGGRLAVRLDTQAEGKTTGTMQEVLRITVLDGGMERPYQTYSGAERFMVDLALRVALSKFLARRAGAEIRLFVLDEGLGACDQANRQAVMQAIQAVAQEFGKTLIITHIAELQDAFPQRIEVTKTGEGSKVRVA